MFTSINHFAFFIVINFGEVAQNRILVSRKVLQTMTAYSRAYTLFTELLVTNIKISMKGKTI